MAARQRRPVCAFLVPLVRNSDRQPHPPVLWRQLQDALMREFSGYTGPETVWGQWSPDGQEEVRDQSRKYSVAVPQARVKELLRLIRRVGNTFDQRAMYVEIAGYAEVIKVRPEDGFLEV